MAIQNNSQKMEKKTIYLAGKVTGLPTELVRERFRKKEKEIELSTHSEVINPVDDVMEYNTIALPQDRLKTWQDEMRFCIRRLMDADELHLLPCWQDSRGATLERDIALRLGMKIVYH